MDAASSGGESAAKDIKESLSWWGISSIHVCSFKLMGDILWEKLPEKKRNFITAGLKRTAHKLRGIDYTKPAHTSVAVKMKFYIIRRMQTSLGKSDPEYTDYKYWKENGWIHDKRPWK